MSQQMQNSFLHKSAHRLAFTLVELLVVISIIGILVGLLLPAVQMTREAARRTQCSNNLKNIGLALHNFEEAYKSLPIGSERFKKTEHAWSTQILPFMEQSAVYTQIDFDKEWDAPPRNFAAGEVNISSYRCPSAVTEFDGKIDYGGIQGTALTELPLGFGGSQAFGCGTLIVTSFEQRRAVRFADITDGLSQTICVGESVDREPAGSGRWACGRNCFSQNAARINTNGLGDLLSRHPQGAQVLFADGHVKLLSESIDARVLGAGCTRNGGESNTNELGSD